MPPFECKTPYCWGCHGSSQDDTRTSGLHLTKQGCTGNISPLRELFTRYMKGLWRLHWGHMQAALGPHRGSKEATSTLQWNLIQAEKVTLSEKDYLQCWRSLDQTAFSADHKANRDATVIHCNWHCSCPLSLSVLPLQEVRVWRNWLQMCPLQWMPPFEGMRPIVAS